MAMVDMTRRNFVLLTAAASAAVAALPAPLTSDSLDTLKVKKTAKIAVDFPYPAYRPLPENMELELKGRVLDYMEKKNIKPDYITWRSHQLYDIDFDEYIHRVDAICYWV